MIKNVMKKHLQNAINKTNTGSVSGQITNTETTYFKLSFKEMFSKVTQNKTEKLFNAKLTSFHQQ